MTAAAGNLQRRALDYIRATRGPTYIMKGLSNRRLYQKCIYTKYYRDTAGYSRPFDELVIAPSSP